MGNSKTLKTRVLAFALTVLMVFGVLPMTIFAIEPAENSVPTEGTLNSGIEFKPPTASDVSNVQYWNDFNALSVGGTYATTGQIATTSGVGTANGGTLSVVDDGNGGAALQNKANSVVHTFFYYYDRWAAQTGNSGTSFVLVADLKMPTADEVQAADIFNIGDRAGLSISPLFLDTDGTIYLGYREDHVYYSTLGGDSDFVSMYVSGALPDGMKVGGAIAKLSADKFTNVALVVDVAANSFKVYIDGVDTTGSRTLFDNAKKEEIVNKGYANGFGLAQARFLLQSKAITDVGAIFDNTLMYFGNTYEGSYSYGVVEDSEYTAPTADKIKEKFGDSALLYYNNFTDAASGVARFYTDKFAISNGEALLTHTATNTQFWPMGENWNGGGHSNYSGSSFVIAFDAKMPEGGLGAAGAFWTANSRDVNGGAFFSPVLYDKDGTIYLGYNGTNCIETNEASFSGTALSSANKVGGKIGQLSTDKYTNIAVVMNPATGKNNFSVYVDGICVAKDLRMFSDGKLSGIAATAYANGWIPRQVFLCNTLGGHGTLNMYFDNFAIYLGDSYFEQNPIIGMYTGTVEGGDLNGYYPENEMMYYYENGVKVGNKVSADGMFTIDENGLVKYGDTPVKSLADYYELVNGILVPVNGVYSGFYTGNLLAGETDGATFYYDKNMNRVVNAPIDIKDDNTGITDTVVGYMFNESGVFTGYLNGLYVFDGAAHVYEDGVRLTGVQVVDENTYFADENGALITGFKYLGGKGWYFDDNYAGAGHTGFGLVEIEGQEPYGQFFIDGVAQTAEDFGDNNPYYFDGYYYYIEEGDKLFKGDGQIYIGDIPYLFDGYKAIKLANAVYGDVYYDGDGVIVTGKEFFKGEDRLGNEVWYHADPETGKLLTGIAKVAGTELYLNFAGVDADEPYVGIIITGAYAYDYDENPETPDTTRYLVDSLVQTEALLVGEYWYVMNEDGDLYENEYTDKPNVFNGKWYVKGGENAYQLVYPQSGKIYVTSDKAPADEAGEHKMFAANGQVNYGDQNGQIAYSGSFVKYDENGSLYVDYGNGVICADGKGYYFGKDYKAVLCDKYYIAPNGAYWNGGKKLNGIDKAVPTEDGEGKLTMYFVDGIPSAGEIPQSDGTVWVFDEYGIKIDLETPPCKIVIILQEKDGDTVTRISKRELFRFWNRAFNYTPVNYKCYGYTITVDGEVVDTVYIAASDRNAHTIVVTYDKTIEGDFHAGYELVETVEGNCVTKTKEIYECKACELGARKEIETDYVFDNHDLETVNTPSEHAVMGTNVTTCKNGCGYEVIEYLPCTPHTWEEVADSRTEATCGNDGSVTYKCSECDKEKTEITCATGEHTYVEVGQRIEPTCDTEGEIYYECSECHKEYTVYVPATCNHAHDPEDTEYEVLPDANAEDDIETRVYDCCVCGAQKVIAIHVVKTTQGGDEEEND